MNRKGINSFLSTFDRKRDSSLSPPFSLFPSILKKNAGAPPRPGPAPLPHRSARERCRVLQEPLGSQLVGRVAEGGGGLDLKKPAAVCEPRVGLCLRGRRRGPRRRRDRLSKWRRTRRRGRTRRRDGYLAFPRRRFDRDRDAGSEGRGPRRRGALRERRRDRRRSGGGATPRRQ